MAGSCRVVSTAMDVATGSCSERPRRTVSNGDKPIAASNKSLGLAQVYAEIRPGLMTPVPPMQPIQRAKSEPWTAMEAAQILMRFRAQIQSKAEPVKPEKEPSPVPSTPPLAPTAFSLPVTDEMSVSSDDEDDAMFLSYGK